VPPSSASRMVGISLSCAPARAPPCGRETTRSRFEVGRRLIREAIVSPPVRSQIRAMPYHRYKVGQTVVAPSGVRDALIPSGPYVIVRLLPLVGQEPHYRVKSTVDGHERALLEGQIRLIVQEPEGKVPASAKALPRRR
jgi:hypothetical protein